MESDAETIQELLEFCLPKFMDAFKKKYGEDKDITPDKVPSIVEKFDIKISEDQVKKLMEDGIGTSKMPFKLFQVYISSCIVKTEFTTLELIKKVPVSHDTSVFHFVLPSENSICGHHFGDYFLVRFEAGKEVFEKKYTPINHPLKKQWLQLVVKNKGGASKELHILGENEMIEFKGPVPQYRWKPKSYRRIGMICGGTGIAPFLPIIEQVIFDKGDKTKISLISHNKCERDILFYHKLKEHSKDERFHCVHVISKSVEKSHFIKGHLNEVICQTFLPKPTAANLILVCGPKDFNEHVELILKELKYPKYHIFES